MRGLHGIAKDPHSIADDDLTEGRVRGSDRCDRA